TRLMRTLQKLARERQFTILIVLHDVSLASYCDEILLIANQAVVAKGSPAAVLNPDNLRQVFDTEMIVLAHPQDQSKLVVLPASL
ncbi:MAG TPA: hemin ABC transporter ATP-binding protein, partial [Alcaligenaceae bacterium]|nr:hemin ABC transporter ATP-binding protein [Alcaligenaceae bacterium]